MTEDFYEGLRLMTEACRRNKAARAKAFVDEWLRLTEEARNAFDDEGHCHSCHLAVLFERSHQNETACATLKECRRNAASRATGFYNAWLRLKDEARIAFDDEERHHCLHLRALFKRLRHNEAAHVKGVDDERPDEHRRQEEAVRAKALAAEADGQRRRADITRAVARVTEPHRHAAAERATALDEAPTMTPSVPPTAVSSPPPALLHMWTQSYIL